MSNDPSEAPPPTDAGGVDETVDDFGDGKVKFKFKRLSERLPGAAWLLLVYGASKSGKTEVAGSAGSRQLYVNTGNREETLLAPGFKHTHPNAHTMITGDITEPTSIPEAFD